MYQFITFLLTFFFFFGILCVYYEITLSSWITWITYLLLSLLRIRGLKMTAHIISLEHTEYIISHILASIVSDKEWVFMLTVITSNMSFFMMILKPLFHSIFHSFTMMYVCISVPFIYPVASFQYYYFLICRT